MSGSSFWRAAMWAGLLSLDITGIGPFMISQPMVAGPIFGWLMGQVKVGIILGGIVQMLWMDVTPVGVGIPFDTMAVTLIGVYGASLIPDAPLPQLMLALGVAVPFGIIFCKMDSYARKVNTWGVRRFERVPDAYLPLALNGGILAGLLWTWLRYTLSYALAMFGVQKAWGWSQQHLWPMWVTQGLTVAAYLLPIAGLGVVLELFLTDEPERRYSALRVFKKN
jgi:mannose/fructose/N-acetylgalactosamine-specific phosphotransferase system component IIC